MTTATSDSRAFRVGLVAPKNSPAEQRWLCGFLPHPVIAEPYVRGGCYDLVWFVNATQELAFVKRFTDAKTFVVCMEPRSQYPTNYDTALLARADRYMTYRNFAGDSFTGDFIPFTFPVQPRARMSEVFPQSLTSTRDHAFCIFATHDPNIRRALATAASPYGCLSAGPLFGHRVPEKLSTQRRCRFELVTENDINEYYLSEKLGEALLAGCVPVYYGCTSAASLFPEDLFIDMHRFVKDDGLPDIERVLAHCLSPGVYERHWEAIRTKALPLLSSRFSLERCLIEPVESYIRTLMEQKWRTSRRTPTWHAWHMRRLLRRWWRAP